MSQPGMLIVHAERCIACKRCMIECAVAHTEAGELAGAMREEPRSQPRVWVKEVGAFTAPYQCRHCAEPPCVPVCPTSSLSRDDATATVRLHVGTCTGAGKCAKKCPFLGIVVDGDAGRAVKCDLCASRLENGGIPACAEACPTDAIVYKTLEELTDDERGFRSGRPGAALVRRTGVRYWVDEAKCIACRKCALVCPAEAVEGAKKTPHKIIQERCITCGACFLNCPADAIQALAPDALAAIASASDLSVDLPAPAQEEVAGAEPSAAETAPEPEAAPHAPAEPAPAASPQAQDRPKGAGTKKQKRIERKQRRKAKKGKAQAKKKTT